MNATIRKISQILAWHVGIALVIGLYFSDNIRGYYRFKEICAKDAGLRVYEPLQKNEGWQTSAPNADSHAGYLLSYYPGISYVRYLDDGGVLRDLKRTDEKKARWDSGFRPQPIDESSQPQYAYDEEFKEVAGEVRMNKRTSKVTNIQSGKIVVTYQDFTYRLFNPDWGSSGGSACSGLNRDDLSKAPNDSKERAIQSAFTK